MRIVTFTTDFGSRDGYAGAMKGVVLSVAPEARLVDITHGVPAQDVPAGAVALAQAAPLFPAGSIHVAVVDPGVGGAQADLLVESGGSFFVGPDNGVLSLAARSPRRIFRIEASGFRREPISPTFHGRDVFAPTAGRLAAGADPAEAGPALDRMVEIASRPLQKRGGVVEGEVIHVDAFGNLITSLPADLFATANPDFAVEVDGGDGRFEPAFGRTFSDVEPGAFIAYVGSGGQLGDRPPRRFGCAANGSGAWHRRSCEDQRAVTGGGRLGQGAVAVALTAVLVGAGGGCTVGSGSGSAKGPLWVTGCTGPAPDGNKGTPKAPEQYSLNPTFFAGDPVEAATQPPTNFFGIRMQGTGSAIQYNDVLTFNIQNSFEVARCLRGRVDPMTGIEDWDHVGLNLGPWCDWSGAGFSADGGAADGGSTGDGGASTGGTPIRPRIRVTSQGYVQASLALFHSCPINLLQLSGPALDGHSFDGWIDFESFGYATTSEPDPTKRGAIMSGFKVDFGERLRATFHVEFRDHRVLTAMETQPNGPVPAPLMGATLDGYFDFRLLRARSAQPFP